MFLIEILNLYKLSANPDDLTHHQEVKKAQAEIKTSDASLFQKFPVNSTGTKHIKIQMKSGEKTANDLAYQFANRRYKEVN